MELTSSLVKRWNVVKAYGEYIPLNKGKIISASQFAGTFSFFDNKETRFCREA
jgi:hypothetical protein